MMPRKRLTCRGHRTIVSLWTLLFSCFYSERLKSGSSSVNAELPDIIKVSTVAGGDAALPCDTRSAQPSDVLLLVAWYKNDIPMYSYDGRIKGAAAHWADDMLGGRAHWHVAEPSMLQIRDVIPTDRALYRCRVDFKISRTMNQKILLDVIELPEKPKIFDDLDREVIGLAGPLVEESSLKLTCVVSGGNPMPRLRWWRDNKVISTLPPLNDGSLLSVLELRIPKLTRDYYEAVYSCSAENTDLVPPLRVNVLVQLYLRPLFVEILSREQPLAVQQTADIACRSVGARPPAVITWWLDGIRLAYSEQKASDNQNETLSILRWTPQMENNGQVLTCRASHAVLKHATIETNVTLDLHYVPIAVLKLGFKLSPEDIEEGDDVYFECAVQANPPAYKIVWEHNGQPMTYNQKAGIIAGSAHLALQAVSRQQAGVYTCTAFNVEGDGKSNPFTLQIIYKPVCKMSSITIVGAILNERTRITCEVDAYPESESFQWVLKNSSGLFDLEPDKFTAENGISTLSFTTTSEADYGTISCKATNRAGQQVEPCRYTLINGVKPERPHNCSTMNMTDDSVELRCVAGYDSGLQTMYVVEVWESSDLLINISSQSPVWKLRGLGSGKDLKLVFYSYNARGRSGSAILRVNMLSRLALLTESNTIDETADASWMLAVLIGLAGAAIAIMVITLLARKRYHQLTQTTETKPYTSTLNGNHSPMQPEDKNPDVIPLGKGTDYTKGLSTLPKPALHHHPYGAGVTSPPGISKSFNNLQNESSKALTTSLASDAQKGTLAEDRRSITSERSFPRRREIVTTRTPLLANTRESCV